MSVTSGATDLLSRLSAFHVVPVAVVEDPSYAEPLGAALTAGGLPCVEVTLRTPAAIGVLRILAQNPDLLVGAGTVTQVQHVDDALEAGAQFIVSPGFSPAVVAACQSAGVPVLPGVSTATEILMALDAGLTAVKFFPAEACGGTATLKALSAPYGQVRFVPTGGITIDRLTAYLAIDAVLAVGGSWMVAASMLREGRFDQVERLTAEAVTVAKAARTAIGIPAKAKP